MTTQQLIDGLKRFPELRPLYRRACRAAGLPTGPTPCAAPVVGKPPSLEDAVREARAPKPPSVDRGSRPAPLTEYEMTLALKDTPAVIDPMSHAPTFPTLLADAIRAQRSK